MKKRTINTALLCCLTVGLTGAAHADVTPDTGSLVETKGPYVVKDPSYTHEREGTILSLENSRIRLDIVPDDDGNILGYHNKRSEEHAFHRLDDNFGDSGYWKPDGYTYTIDDRGPERVAVTLIGKGMLLLPALPGETAAPPIRLQIKRTVSIDGYSTRMRVDVTVTNLDKVTAPGLRYAIHPLFLQPMLPGPLYYIFMPYPEGVQTFSYERLNKGNYLSRTAGEKHPFRAWSKHHEDIAKGRYPALGWLAMGGGGGHVYISYDPQRFDFISLWTGAHPAEWLTMEPNTKATDLAPGQSMTVDFTLALDAKDLRLKEPAAVLDAVEVPPKLAPGQDYEVSMRVTTFLDSPQPAVLQWHLQDAKRRPVDKRLFTASLTPFRFTPLIHKEKLPANIAAGNYDWSVTDADSGRQLAGGRFEVQAGALKNKNRKVAQADNGKFPPANWTNSVGMAFVRIPAAEFWMGSDDASAQADEKPRHRVRLTHDFLMGKQLVTNEDFRRFQPNFSNGRPWNVAPFPEAAFDGAKQPAMPSGIIGNEGVTVDDYFVWLNANDKNKPQGWEYRLPTEAEWEYAARGPEGRKYPWGNTWDSHKANFGDLGLIDGFLSTSPVGQFSSGGDSPFGISDMAGNVWEWCADYYDEDFYAKSPLQNPVNTNSVRAFEFGFDGKVISKTRTLRGGSWGSMPDFCRTTTRYGIFGIPHIDAGFRVVLAPIAAKVP